MGGDNPLHDRAPVVKAYPDSNFLAAYFLDPESVEASVLAGRRRLSTPLPTFWLHRFEVANALLHYAFAAASGAMPRVSQEWALAARGAFLDALDEAEGSALKEVALPPLVLWRRFDELSLRHTARHGYRTYDLLHVAAALLLECDTFWSFDKKASELAKREGLRVISAG